MFERFDNGARRVVVLAQEEARLLNHNYIGTEHLLLGIIHVEEEPLASALLAMNVKLVDARERVRALVGEGTQAPSGHIPFTPRAKKALEMSLRQALQLGHNYIGTAHILLGLIGEGQGIAVQVLSEVSDLAALTAAVIGSLPGPEPPVVVTVTANDQQEDVAEPEESPHPITRCVAILDEMDPRQRKATIAYLRAWYSG